MATSRVQIANFALSKIGEESIASLTENSKAARVCNLIFDQALDYLLQIYPWNFAQEKKRLAQLSSTPLYDYDFEYQLPTDPYCLQVNGADGDIEYVIEGKKLLTDESAVYITYTKRIEDMTELTATFVEVLVYYLASELAFHISNTQSLSQTMYALYERALKYAIQKDANERSTQEVPDGEWITCRY